MSYLQHPFHFLKFYLRTLDNFGSGRKNGNVRIGGMKKVGGNGRTNKTYAHGVCPPQSNMVRAGIEPRTLRINLLSLQYVSKNTYT